jgi:hypothetical protein
MNEKGNKNEIYGLSFHNTQINCARELLHLVPSRQKNSHKDQEYGKLLRAVEKTEKGRKDSMNSAFFCCCYGMETAENIKWKSNTD